MREEHKLGVFKNRVIFGPKREEVKGQWRRLHDDLGDQINKNEMSRTCSMYGAEDNV